jgi:site-specific DNA-cytosine methylase
MGFNPTGGTHSVDAHFEMSPTVRVGSGLGIPSAPAVLAFRHTQDPTWPDVAMPLMARDAKGPRNYMDGGLQISAVQTGRPRRLTPKECERLMSWPDDHTRYGRKGDGTVYELSDTARYRLCGNGVGSVQVQWIAERLSAAIKNQ